MTETPDTTFPSIRTAGIDGYLVSFGDRLGEAANRAAIAFRAAIEDAGWDHVRESSTSLVSTYLRFDPLTQTHDAMRTQIETLLATRNWLSADLPQGRRLWRIPTVFGGDHGPELDEAAALAGLSPADAIAELAATPVRVQTIGFAPGMPYLGELPAHWNIPRKTELTARVAAGGVCVAIRQLVLFPNPTPTGWRHIGQTHFRLFRADAPDPFTLRPGDELLFTPVSPDELAACADDPTGGAKSEPIP